MPVGRAVQFEFRIDSLTPETLSMKHLGDYLAQLARLVGEEEHVHFDRVKAGSAILKFSAEFSAAPKVRARIEQIQSAPETDEVRKPARALNIMLANDNAIGELREIPRGVIARFPGREQSRARIGPVFEEGTVEGVLVRIGGVDKTAHALIETAERQVVSCTVSRDLARELGVHLYSHPLRFIGRGRWFRDEAGQWLLDDFTANSFERLEPESLASTFERLASIPENPLRAPGALLKWQKQRRNG